jgi:hypothetical protein
MTREFFWYKSGNEKRYKTGYSPYFLETENACRQSLQASCLKFGGASSIKILLSYDSNSKVFFALTSFGIKNGTK